MKKRILSLLLFYSTSILFCHSTTKATNPPLSNINTDFPSTQKLDLILFKEYDFLPYGPHYIEGSILWYFKDNSRDCGSCYDLNTGKKLSVIATKGDAPHELTKLETFAITNDFVLLYPQTHTIKAFAKKDIVNNIPPENRKYTATTIPKDILTYNITMLPNGSILATIEPPLMKFGKNKREDINKNSVVIINNNNIKSYQTIKYDSFDIPKIDFMGIKTNDLIKQDYAQGKTATKGNDIAVFSVRNQFILYTLDLNNGKVTNEKRYTKMQISQPDNDMVQLSTFNDMSLNVINIASNDQYIFCHVTGYFNEKNKQAALLKEMLFVFDWNLKPIKKFELTAFRKEKDGHYLISKDCRSVYFCERTKEGRLTLYRANINM